MQGPGNFRRMLRIGSKYIRTNRPGVPHMVERAEHLRHLE
jgi:hypothetical protein